MRATTRGLRRCIPIGVLAPCFANMALPIDVSHVRAANELVIVWDDGRVTTLPIPYLRSWCACATCQGHQKHVRFHPSNPAVTLLEMWEVGAYALGLRFSDGHDTGIYRWNWLRVLGPENEPRGLKTRGYFFDEHYYPEPGKPAS